MWKSICRRSFICLCCLSLFLSVFGFSASAEMADGSEGTNTVRWVDDGKSTITYWRLARRAAGEDTVNGPYVPAWLGGYRNSDSTGYVYQAGRRLNNGSMVPYDSIYCQLNLCRTQDYIYRGRIPSGWGMRVTVSGSLKNNGTASLRGAIYSVAAATVAYDASIGDYDWDHGRTVPLIRNSATVSDLDMFTDTWGGFMVSANLKNNGVNSPDILVAALRLIIDIPFTASNYMDLEINDVKLTYYRLGMDVEQEFESSDHSTGDVVAISGFFSFLNKPLNIIINAYKKVGDWVWSRLPSSMQNAFTIITEHYGGFWDMMKAGLRQFVSDPLGSIKTGLDVIGQGFQAVGNRIWDLFPSWLQNAITAIRDFVSNFWNWQIDHLKSFVSDPLGTIKEDINGLWKLFLRIWIPEDGFAGMVQRQWEKVSEFGEQHLGGLWQSGSIFVDLLERFKDVKVNEKPTITLPEIKVADTVLLKAQTYSFDFSKLPFIGTMHTWYLNMVDFILAGSMLTLLFKKIQEVLMH